MDTRLSEQNLPIVELIGVAALADVVLINYQYVERHNTLSLLFLSIYKIAIDNLPARRELISYRR